MASANDVRMRIIAEDKTAAAFRSVKKGLGGVQNAAANAKRAIIGGAALAGSFTILTKKLAASADEIAKFSKRTGIAGGALQELQFAAEQSGVSAETFNKSIVNLVKNFSDAADGTGEAYDEIKRLGIELKDSNNQMRPAEDLLMDLADAMAGMTNDTDKLAVATKIFGGRGSAMVQMLEEGSVGMEKLRKEARDLGIVMSDETLANAEGITDEFNKMSKVISRNLTTALVDLKPLWVNLSIAIAGAAKALKSFLDPLSNFNTNEEKLNKVNQIIDRVYERIDYLQNAMAGGKRSFSDVLFGTSYEEANAELTTLKEGLAKLKITRDALIDAITTPVSIAPKVEDDPLTKNFTDIKNGMNSGVETYMKGVKSLADSTADVTTKIFKGMEDAIVNFVETGKLNFKDFARSIISDLIRIQVQQQITSRIAGWFRSITGGGETPAPGKAIGGPVQAGKPYMVGERGPELIVPNQNGSVIPNGELSAAGGVTINQTIQVSTGVQQTVRAEIANMMPQIANATKAAVASARMRGGSFSASMGV